MPSVSKQSWSQRGVYDAGELLRRLASAQARCHGHQAMYLAGLTTISTMMMMQCFDFASRGRHFYTMIISEQQSQQFRLVERR